MVDGKYLHYLTYRDTFLGSTVPVSLRDGVVNLYRCWDFGELRYWGVVSIWMARTDEGLRKGERALGGV